LALAANPRPAECLTMEPTIWCPPGGPVLGEQVLGEQVLEEQVLEEQVLEGGDPPGAMPVSLGRADMVATAAPPLRVKPGSIPLSGLTARAVGRPRRNNAKPAIPKPS
jgi:hypothetical protein